MAKRTRRVFEVTGTGSFPLDMLRYDHCAPHRGEDSETLSVATQPYNKRIRGGQYEIQLVSSDESIVRNGATLPRWESFGWKITNPDVR